MSDSTGEFKSSIASEIKNTGTKSRLVSGIGIFQLGPHASIAFKCNKQEGVSETACMGGKWASKVYFVIVANISFNTETYQISC